MGKQAPAAPNYTGAADATAKSNRPNISTPFGNQQWTQNPDGTWGMSTKLNGALGSTGNILGGQAADAMANPLDLSSLGPMVDPTQARQEAIDSAYSQATSRLDPMWQQREEATRTRLANQGLDPNSEAARNLTEQEGRMRSDAYGSAMNSAIMQGNQAGNMLFQQGLQGRQQQLMEMLRQRGQPLAEMQALMGLTQMPGVAPGADYLGAAAAEGNYNLNKWGAENQANADMVKGGMDLVGQLGPLAFLLLSDRRAKRDIVYEDKEALPGVRYASWEYLDRPGVRFRGVVAQDLQQVAPELVVKGADGLLRVNYDALREIAQ